VADKTGVPDARQGAGLGVFHARSAETCRQSRFAKRKSMSWRTSTTRSELGEAEYSAFGSNPMHREDCDAAPIEVAVEGDLRKFVGLLLQTPLIDGSDECKRSPEPAPLRTSLVSILANRSIHL
jgi:hypothetical protein